MQARALKVVTVGVKDLDSALETFQRNFGFPLTRRGSDQASGAQSAYLGIGKSEIELVQPGKSGGPLDTFIQDRGEGLYLLKLEVDDLRAAAAELERRGIEARSDVDPAGRSRLWVNPRGAHGVLLLLSQSE